MFALLLWFALNISKRISGENEVGTAPNYFNFSKDVTKELQNKEELSPGGRIAKQNTLSPLNGEAGILFKNEKFQIEYYPPLNNLSERFVVQINSQPFEETKEDVRQWFISKGFSDSDVCALPLAFYPSPDLLTDEQTSTYNPVLENCE